MHDVFYGREPEYFAHYARQTAAPYAQYSKHVVPWSHCGLVETSCDMMGPINCNEYEDQMTMDTRHLVAARASNQVRWVKDEAALCSSGISHSEHDFSASSFRGSSHGQQCYRSSSDSTYSRTNCPRHRVESVTGYVSANQGIVTRTQYDS